MCTACYGKWKYSVYSWTNFEQWKVKYYPCKKCKWKKKEQEPVDNDTLSDDLQDQIKEHYEWRGQLDINDLQKAKEKLQEKQERYAIEITDWLKNLLTKEWREFKKEEWRTYVRLPQEHEQVEKIDKVVYPNNIKPSCVRSIHKSKINELVEAVNHLLTNQDKDDNKRN